MRSDLVMSLRLNPHFPEKYHELFHLRSMLTFIYFILVLKTFLFHHMNLPEFNLLVFACCEFLNPMYLPILFLTKFNQGVTLPKLRK